MTKNKLYRIWDGIQSSYWFVPALMAAGAGLLALGTVALDEGLQDQWIEELAWIYTRGPEGARAVLSTVAGSMITVAGVVFSITIVALTLASNQFGPRVLRNFMSDRGNQIVLGTFIATFLYCLLVLRTIRSTASSGDFVPHASVFVAVLLAIASLSVLIYFIHHVAMSIQATQLVARVSEELHGSINELFPEELGRNDHPDEEPNGAAEQVPEGFDREALPVHTTREGYIQAIEDPRLLELAAQNDLLLKVAHRPGHFVMGGSPLVLVWPGERLNAELAKEIRAAFVLGSHQTPTQDAEFAVNQLVQVAVRALSPGFNDPFTAVVCVDRLAGALCHLAGRKIPSPYRRDGNGRLRVIAYPMTFPDVADTAFRQIRQYGRSSPAVLIRLLEVLAEVMMRARREGDRAALLRQGLLVHNCAEALPEEADRQVLHDRYRKLLEQWQESQTPAERSALQGS